MKDRYKGTERTPIGTQPTLLPLVPGGVKKVTVRRDLGGPRSPSVPPRPSPGKGPKKR